MQQARLRQDVKSMFKGKVYGLRGELVNLISWDGTDVWIVEGKQGRFPVNNDDLIFNISDNKNLSTQKTNQ